MAFGLVLVAVIAGLGFATAAAVMSFPLWTVIACYPVFGAAALLLSALAQANRDDRQSRLRPARAQVPMRAN